MILKITHTLALCIGILVCTICLPGQFENSGQGPSGGGVIEPFTYSPQNGLTDEPQSRQQSTVDERIWGSSVVPAGGAGLRLTLPF